MSIFSKAEQVAAGILHSATEFLTKIFGQAALDHFEAEIKTIFEQDTIVIFQDAIAAAESLTVDGQAATGAQKRDSAFAQILKDLEASGKGLGTNAINLGIEMVVGLLKAKTPAAN